MLISRYSGLGTAGSGAGGESHQFLVKWQCSSLLQLYDSHWYCSGIKLKLNKLHAICFIHKRDQCFLRLNDYSFLKKPFEQAQKGHKRQRKMSLTVQKYMAFHPLFLHFKSYVRTLDWNNEPR